MSNSTRESFQQLLEESFAGKKHLEGTVVKATVVQLQNGVATFDIGLKSEGRICIKDMPHMRELKVGDVIDVYLERIEDKNGEAMLSIEKARRENVWADLEKIHQEGKLVTGIMFRKVPSGFAVDCNGVIAFLPGSQVNVRTSKDSPIDVSQLMNVPQPFKILKMDRLRNSMVISRRAVLEESRAEARSELLSSINEGQIITGEVKSVVDYGAFIDLGGVDGLLHSSDISWGRVAHPSSFIKEGDKIQVKVIRFNKETRRISLGIKQLQEDPWNVVDGKYQAGDRHTGRVVDFDDYYTYVELEHGIEGRIYVTDLSWVKKNINPKHVLTLNEEIEVKILEIEISKKRIELGLKQCQDNPWRHFMDNNPVGSHITGKISDITEFGIFVRVSDDLDGIVNLEDLSWTQSGDEAIKDYAKGGDIQVKILDIQPEKERIILGVKQLESDPFEDAVGSLKKGDVVTGVVSEINERGVEVRIQNIATGFIRKVDLSRDRSHQRPDKFAVGEKVDAQVLNVDRMARKVNLSIKAYELEEEKKVLSKFGSSDSGASLGDVLGQAMKNFQEKE